MTTFQSACEALKSSTIPVRMLRSTSLPAPWYQRLSSVCAAAAPARQVVASRPAVIRVSMVMVFLLRLLISVENAGPGTTEARQRSSPLTTMRVPSGTVSPPRSSFSISRAAASPMRA